MGLFNRGESTTGMLLDGEHAIKAYHGSVLVWDGTRPAFVSVLKAPGSATARVPSVAADSSPDVTPAVSASALVFSPSMRATAIVDPEVINIPAVFVVPLVTADSFVAVEVATGSVQALAAEAGESNDWDNSAVAAAGSASVLVPVVDSSIFRQPAEIVVLVATPVPVVTATGSGTVAAVAVAASVAVGVPAVSANGLVVALKATASASANTPALSAGWSVTAVKATATATAKAPAVSSALIPAGRLQSVDYQGNPNSTWYEIPSANWGSSWASYPLTVPSGNGVVISGGGLARIVLTTKTVSGTGARMARFKVNGVANSESTAINSANPYVQTFDNVALAAGDVVVPEFRNNGTIASQRTFTECSIEITAMP